MSSEIIEEDGALSNPYKTRYEKFEIDKNKYYMKHMILFCLLIIIIILLYKIYEEIELQNLFIDPRSPMSYFVY